MGSPTWPRACSASAIWEERVTDMDMEKPEHLGPMARSLIETFAGLTLPQQRRVFDLMREIMETNERAAALGEAADISEARPSALDRQHRSE